MPETARTRTASRSAFLDLRDEQRLVNDGYEFLDEKRILLAAELLRQREAWREANTTFMGRWREATKALPAAVADQGLEGLLVHPRYPLEVARFGVTEWPYVGQVMLEASMEVGDAALSREPVRPSQEVRRCADAFRALLEAAVPLASMSSHRLPFPLHQILWISYENAGSAPSIVRRSAAVSACAAAEEMPFEYLCTIDTFAVIGADPVTTEVFKAAATRTPRDLVVQDTYVVRPGGVREAESDLLWADWRCVEKSAEVFCTAGADVAAATKGYFHIDASGFFRAHNTTEVLQQIAIGLCQKTSG